MKEDQEDEIIVIFSEFGVIYLNLKGFVNFYFYKKTKKMWKKKIWVFVSIWPSKTRRNVKKQEMRRNVNDEMSCVDTMNELVKRQMMCLWRLYRKLSRRLWIRLSEKASWLLFTLKNTTHNFMEANESNEKK